MEATELSEASAPEQSRPCMGLAPARGWGVAAGWGQWACRGAGLAGHSHKQPQTALAARQTATAMPRPRLPQHAPGAKGSPRLRPSGVLPVALPYTTLEVMVSTLRVGEGGETQQQV